MVFSSKREWNRLDSKTRVHSNYSSGLIMVICGIAQWEKFQFYCLPLSELKKYLGWFSGDRNTAPSLLVRALYRRDHRAVQKFSWISCYIQGTLNPTGLGDFGYNARATYFRGYQQTRTFLFFMLMQIFILKKKGCGV